MDLLTAIKVIQQGVKVWTFVRPVKTVRNGIRRLRNKRRAKKGKALLPMLNDGEIEMFPKGTMTYSGITLMVVTALTFGLTVLGVPEECPEPAPTVETTEVVEECISAEDLSVKLVEGGSAMFFGVSTIIAIRGRKRATKKT